MNTILDQVEKGLLKKNIPAFRPGDLVRVDVKVVEGESERVQAFEGVVIRRRGHGMGATFTVRKVSFGVGVERTFPLHSPRVEHIKVMRAGQVRRAKLYYLRDLTGKAARISEKESASGTGEVGPETPPTKTDPTPPPAKIVPQPS